MDSRERIKTALANGMPDRVPVTLGLSEMVPVRESGLTYIEYFWHEKRNPVRDRCDLESGYGADVFLHSAESPSPFDPEVTRQAVRETGEELVYREIIHTARGELECLKRMTPREPAAVLEGFVKSPGDDFPAVLETLKNPGTKDFGAYTADSEYVGSRGHCGFWLPTPVDWWASLRRGPEEAIYDMIDSEGLIENIFREYTEYSAEMIRVLLSGHADAVDSIGLGGSTTSMSVISPKMLERYAAPFVRAVKSVSSAYGVPVQYHMCGKSREAVPILVEAGTDGMDALEPPPGGNVDLGEVKTLFGDRISLRGNVGSVSVMLRGGPEDVERDVLRCMNQAKKGGGFILGVGDQMPYWTPVENIHAMVEAGRVHGACGP